MCGGSGGGGGRRHGDAGDDHVGPIRATLNRARALHPQPSTTRRSLSRQDRCATRGGTDICGGRGGGGGGGWHGDTQGDHRGSDASRALGGD